VVHRLRSLDGDEDKAHLVLELLELVELLGGELCQVDLDALKRQHAFARFGLKEANLAQLVLTQLGVRVQHQLYSSDAADSGRRRRSAAM
jgi:hypothetical protein